MPKFLDFLRTSDLPLLARPSFGRERVHIALWSLVVGVIEGNIAGVVVSSTFKASELLTTVVWALPLLANALNIFWGAFLRGKRRIPSLFLLAGGAAASVGSLALTPGPEHPWAGWCFAGQMAVAHVFLSGLITLRSSIWRANYPDSRRATIAGRLQSLRFMGAMIAASLVGLLFEFQPLYFRFVYPTIAVVGGLSLLPLRRLRVRGESRELRRPAEHIGEADGGQVGYARARTATVASSIWEALRIPARDRAFGAYLTAQFFLGAANFMVDPMLLNVLTKQVFVGEYFIPQMLMQTIPQITQLMAIPFWAGYFDRVGVLRFRVWNSAYWVVSWAGIAVAMALWHRGGPAYLVPAILILVGARLLNGIGRGGGAVAWQLGHLHFSPKHQAELYMSVHVALTGVRGLMMPFVGWALYAWLGWGVFVLATCVGLFAQAQFARLVRLDARRAATEAERHAEEIESPAAGADQAT